MRQKDQVRKWLLNFMLVFHCVPGETQRKDDNISIRIFSFWAKN